MEIRLVQCFKALAITCTDDRAFVIRVCLYEIVIFVKAGSLAFYVYIRTKAVLDVV